MEWKPERSAIGRTELQALYTGMYTAEVYKYVDKITGVVWGDGVESNNTFTSIDEAKAWCEAMILTGAL